MLGRNEFRAFNKFSFLSFRSYQIWPKHFNFFIIYKTMKKIPLIVDFIIKIANILVGKNENQLRQFQSDHKGED